MIDALPLHAGDLAGPDVPVATLVSPDAGRVVACIPEARAGIVEPGLEAEVTSTYDNSQGEGTVESVTGTIGPLPARCQVPGSKAVQMGRVAIVALDAPMGGLPGQTQRIKFGARRKPHDRAPSSPQARTPEGPGSATPPAPPTEQPAMPSALSVPSELLARSRFEPSGIVWVPALDRYVVVSDDTGQKKQDDHAPWLFTMTEAGAVDAQPLVVNGVAELNDIESISLDDKGALWLLASQSESAKGKRPESRRHLVHVVIGKSGEIKADKVLDFVTLLDAAPAPVRAALGVVDTRALDIEGMAWHDGALYFGLKAPVDGDGKAQIWRAGAPDKLLAGDLANAQLAPWSKIKLAVEADGRSVPAGIADLIFWDKDTLVISATASGVDARTQAGAVYAAKVAAGELVPVHLRTFADLKPEGLARGPKGNLTVVFDRGAEAAQWVQLPPPKP